MATEGNRLGGTDFDTKMLTADEIIALLEGKQDLIQPYMQDPLMDGTASYGNISTYAAGNHRHPTDTSRQGQLVAQQVGGGKVRTVVAQILNNGSLTSVELATKDFVPDGSQYVLKAGDTMTGALTVKTTLTVGSRKSGSTVGSISTAEGNSVTASGKGSHAEGNRAAASGEYSHAEGIDTTASGAYSHAEGINTVARSEQSHAEGSNTTASGGASHAEGGGTTASGRQAHAEGGGTTASGSSSHAEGAQTVAQNDNEHAQGSCNASHKASATFGNAGNTLSSIGFGADTSNRKNAVEVMQDGKVFVYGLGGYDGTNPTGSGVKDLVTAIGSGGGGQSDRIVSQDGDTRVVANDDGTATLDNDYLASRPIVHLTAGTFSGGHREIVLQNDVTANMNEATPVTTPGGTHYDLTIDGVTYSYGADSSQGVVYRWFNVNSEYGFDITDWDSRNPTIALNDSTGASYTGTATASRLATGSKTIATVDQIEHVDIVSPTTDGSGSGKAADANATGLAMELSPVYSEWTTVPAEYNGYPIVIRLVNNVNWSPFANGEQIGMGYSDSGQLSLNWPADSAYIPIAATRSIDGYTLGGQTEKPLASMSSVPSEKIVSKDGNTSVKANNDGTATLLSPGTVSKTVVLSAEGTNGVTFRMEFSSFNSPEELASATPESISGTLTITVPGSSSPGEFTDTWYRIQPESGAPVYVAHNISQDWRFYFTSSNCDIFSGSGGGGCTAVYTTGSVDVPTTVTKTLATTDQIPVVPSASDATPQMDGGGEAGTATTYARGDHQHPTCIEAASAGPDGVLSVQAPIREPASVIALNEIPTVLGMTTALGGKQDTISDLDTIRSGAEKGLNSVQQTSTYRMDIAENGDVTVSPNGSYVYSSKYGTRDQSNQLTAFFNSSNTPDYSGSDTYSTGDHVVYGGKTYLCLENNTTGVVPDSDPSSWSLATDFDLRGFFVEFALSGSVDSAQSSPVDGHVKVLYYRGPLQGGAVRYEARESFEFDAKFNGSFYNATNLQLYSVDQKDGSSTQVTSSMAAVTNMQTASVSDNTGSGGPFVVAGGPLVWSLTSPGFDLPADYVIPRSVPTVNIDTQLDTFSHNPVENSAIATETALLKALIDALSLGKAESLAVAPAFSPGSGAPYRDVGDLVTYVGYLYRCKIAGYDSIAHKPGEDQNYWEQVSVADELGNVSAALDAILGN